MSSHADHSEPHKPHVLPLTVYFGVGSALFILTIVTVLTARIDLDAFVQETSKLDISGLNLILAMAIATVKGTLVALFFMHLLYDNKIFLTIFVGGLLFLSFFFVFTLFDTMHRDRIYKDRDTVWTESKIYTELRNNPDTVKSAYGHGDHSGDAHEGDAHEGDAHEGVDGDTGHEATDGGTDGDAHEGHDHGDHDGHDHD